MTSHVKHWKLTFVSASEYQDFLKNEELKQIVELYGIPEELKDK